MCVICVSAAGVPQPTMERLRSMFNANRDGAGYMVARGGMVEIHKGFMNWSDFSRAVCMEHFTAADPVVYHFRISTQAGRTPEMTHPFPLTDDLENCRLLDLVAPCGVAHNGIIRQTSNGDPDYSDTALYITEYLSSAIQGPDDLKDPEMPAMLAAATASKWAIMDGSGEIVTAGRFYDDGGGVMVSNQNHRADLFNRRYR